MLKAKHIDGDTWLVSESDEAGKVVQTYRIAVKTGGTEQDAIAAIENLTAAAEADELAGAKA